MKLLKKIKESYAQVLCYWEGLSDTFLEKTWYNIFHKIKENAKEEMNMELNIMMDNISITIIFWRIYCGFLLLQCKILYVIFFWNIYSVWCHRVEETLIKRTFFVLIFCFSGTSWGKMDMQLVRQTVRDFTVKSQNVTDHFKDIFSVQEFWIDV